MKRFLLVLAVLTALVFALSSCGRSKKEGYEYPDEDPTDITAPDKDTDSTVTPDDGTPDEDSGDTGDIDEPEDSDTADDSDEDGTDDSDTSAVIVDDDTTDNDIPGSDDDTDTTEPDEDSDTPEIPDQDSDTPETLEATENHKISGIYQAGTNVSGIEAALYECGGTEKIASSITNANGKYSFNADISAEKTYCVKADGFASCFKGMSDHVANISEITNAAYLIDETCSDIRKSETKVRLYAKLGTGTWLGELDYSKLSGIKNGLRLLSSYLNINDPKILSQKIAADVKKTDGREFYKFFNGFKISADRNEVKINTRNASSNEVTLTVEGGSSVVADGFHIVWTAQNKTTSAATRKFRSSDPGEYTVRAKLVAGGDPIMQDEGGDPIMGGNGDDGGDPIMAGDPIMITEDSSTLLFLLEKLQGTIDVRDMSKDISQYIDNGIYAVIPKNTVITKSNSQPAKELTYSILTAGDASQISKIDFGPDGTTFTGDSIYFVYELGTVFGGDPIMLSATRTASDGSSEVLQSAGGDPIMLAAGGDPIMFSAAGDPIMQIARSAGGDPIMLAAGGDPIMLAAGGDPIMLSAGGDPIMLSSGGDPTMLAAGGDPIMQSSGGDPIMNAAGGDPIMNTAAGDPIMLGTSSSVMIAKSGHFSGFLLNSHSLPVSVGDLLEKWCNTYYYQGYSPLEFVSLGVTQYKPEGEDKDELLSYLTCQRLGELESDLYELINKPVGFQRNLNLIENIYFISEFYNRMLAKSESGEVAAVKNGLELRSAIAALYTATTTYNRSSTLADLFDSSKIPLTYSGSAPADYSSDAQKAMTGLSEINDRYIASKKDLMIFANYITTSSNVPDFSAVSSPLSPDKLVCAWFNPDTAPQDCNKVYTINEAGHVALGGTEISVAEANAIFSRFFMPFNSRISDEEKLSLFRTFYLAVRYAGTVFYGGTRVEDLNEKLLKTAYLVFDGINRNRSAVSIVDSFDPAAHTVKVLENGSLETTPYINKLSTLTDMISLNVANPADVEKVLININGYEFDQIRENTRIYYKPKGTLKEKSIALTPGTLAAGLKPLKDLLGSENVDELGNITGKMTVVVNSKISNKTYSTQKTYEFLIYGENEGVDSKPVPSDISVFLFDSEGSPISEAQNPGIILNPGNKAFYPDHDGRINITGLAPASYTIDAFADGYYAKSVGVNVPENSNPGVEIRLDEEVTSSAEAVLTVKVRINTAKYPEKVYLQIYDENMDLVANESAQFSGSAYEDVEIDINFGRFTLLAVGEEMYNYIEDITVNRENTVKEITVVAKNACGNGIIDSTEECEAAGIETPAAVRCGDIYPASMNPDNMTSCNPATCLYDKQDCGKSAVCGDGVIDLGEGCDTKSKNCSDITGFAGTKGVAPCASDCSDWITAGSCSKTEALCGTLPANALWNDGTGRFTQVYDGENWAPATKSASYGLTKDECVFSCRKGYKWDETHSICAENPLSLGNICTGAVSCFDDTGEGECPAYGEAFFGQDWQYAEAGFCTPKELKTTGTGSEKTVVDSFTHYEWHQTAGSAKTWSNADKYCMQSTYAGKNDWRLPSPAELLTIVDSSTASPALDDHFTVSGYNFWATEDKKNTENAWRVTQSGALMSVAKTTKNYVICVRVSEYAAPANRFETAAETVTDKVSSLMWQKSPSSSKSWREALNYCEEISTGGSFDWRLPNRNELASLVDHTKANGAMSDFPGIAAKAFWTSTTKISEIENAWTVNFESGSIESANKTDTKHVLCVRNGGTCFGDECATPCSFDPCRHIENSTGTCREADGAFSCGCKSGFSWSSGKCIIKTTKYTPCTGLPENAKWNTVFGISQTYDGSRWIPSETGYFNSNASSEECRFICDTNYNWDPDLNRCVAQSKLTSCSGKKPNSVWNEATKINQTWNGEAWEPSETPVFSETSCSESCCFKCKEHFNWNAANEECDPATRNDVECTGLAEHASWWNDPYTITQTWDDNAGDWYPTTTGTYKSDAGDNGCFFKCNENYEWNQALRKCAPKTEYNVACTGLTDPNAEWNQFSTINQTWNEAEEKYLPSTEGTYSATANPERCYFKCKLNFTWNGNICVADTRQAECTGLKSNASWVNSVITQTWNGSEWEPTTAGHHESDSNEGCAFTCKTNYNWKNGGCQAATQPADCDNSTLPAYAQWWNTGITQTWNGYEWLPTTVGSYNDSADNTRCYFRCDEHYNWNTTARRCEPKTRQENCSGTLPDNAEWNIYTKIMQTWSDAEGKYLPALTGTYNETPDPNECRYKCKLNYTWNGESCVANTRQAECTGLKSNSSWINGTGIITQTWNGSEWKPGTAGSHAEQSNNSECLYECNENYGWNDHSKQCEANTQTVTCNSATLPAHALWWKEPHEVVQEWNGFEWLPTNAGSYSSDISEDDNGCFFKCQENYNWNQTYRRCDPKTNEAACDNTTLPDDNAEWNVYTRITQTWDETAGENGDWTPSTSGTYNEIPSPNECRFKCKTNYTYDGSKCAANTRQVKCVKNEPHTTWWNDNPILTQTWSGSEWKPEETTGEYSSTEPQTDGCFYKCEEHYVRRGSSCEPETQSADCDNSTLPAHAEWWNGEDTLIISQEWNSAYENWYPTTTGTYKSHWTEEDNGCFFKCSENYKWNSGTISCEPETKYTPCIVPENAVSNGATSVYQTWKEETRTYEPSETAEYSTIPSNTECKFKCVENYFYNGSECVSPCDPNPCGEHSVCTATSFNYNDYECSCDSGYLWEQSKCNERRFWSFENHRDDTSSGRIFVDNSAEYHWSRMADYGGHTGSYAMCSNTYYKDLFDSEMTITVDMPADGIISFYIKGIADSTLKLYIDGTDNMDVVLNSDFATGEPYSIGGTGWMNWTKQTFHLTAGQHTLIFSDYNLYSSDPGFCIDDFTILPECYSSGTPCIDSSNGLIWSAESPEVMTWQNALDYCNNDYSESGINSNWYLPNINELRTLAQNCEQIETGGTCAVQDSDCLYLYGGYDCYNSCSCTDVNIDGIHSKFGDDNLWFWSSSNVLNYSEYVWIESFTTRGKIGYYDKSLDSYVRCTQNVCDEGKLWNGNECVDPCTAALCSSAENSTGTCVNDYECGCNDGYFWHGKDCIDPCAWNSCVFVSHSTNKCILPTAWNKYSCECDNGYFWSGRDCVDPCENNICQTSPTSTGECTATAWNDYDCSCDSGYFWDGTACVEPLNIEKICTGVNKCYTENETPSMNCPAPNEPFFGQDLQYAAAVCTPQSFSLRENEKGSTVRDNKTGLTWEKSPSEEKYSWYNRETHCNELNNSNYGGKNNWRVPNPFELLTITDSGRYNPATNTDSFENMQGMYLWTSKQHSSNNAFRFSTTWGGTWNVAKSNEYSVFCVSGNELVQSAASDFTTSSDGKTFTDNRTGLIWQKESVTKTWQEALAYCLSLNNSNYGGHSTGWRLPNKNELASLMDFGKSDAPYSNFPDADLYEYWSSTSYVRENYYHYAWHVNFSSGIIDVTNKQNNKYVRCVRSDICEEGEFWNGTTCIHNPCYEDRCGSFSNSTGNCRPIDSTAYSCECQEGYHWLGTVKGCSNEFISIGNICTNQNKCFDDNAELTVCPAQGADFYGQDAQYTSKCIQQSFTATSNVVVDNNTGLTWEKSPSSNKYSWGNRENHCTDLNNSNYGGKNNWRVPNPLELMSIIDNSTSNPATNSNFSEEQTIVWTSKSYDSGSYAYYFSLLKGTCYDGPTQPTGPYYFTYNIICVSGNEMQPSASSDFVTSSDNMTVADLHTGLIWQKAHVSDKKTWKQALAYCQSLNNESYGGYSTGWRLPNKNELASLWDVSKSVLNFSGYLWSSSTYADSTNYAWRVGFGGYSIAVRDKTDNTDNTINVRCVRYGENPCDNNPCDGKAHSTEICTALSFTEYFCGCENGYFWDSSTETCVNPCDNDPCEGAANSVCIPNSVTEYMCSCSNANDGYFWNGEACVNPCDNDPCESAENSVCTPTSATNFTCSCENASEGFFWNNENKACENPCEPNLCEDDGNSNGNCTGINATTYSCGCKTNYFWNSSAKSCKSPCDPNPCSSIDHATETCTVTSASTFTCGCDSGYAWANFQCIKNKWSFEDDDDMPTYTTSSDYSWTRSTALGAVSGSYAMCSGNYKVKNSRSSMTITVNMPKSGTASFYIKGLAEKGLYLLTPRYDHFTFYSSYSSFYLDSDNTYDHGWESWEYVTFSLGSGKQTLSFYYEKDDYASSGLGDNRDDRFCIDDLEINW